MNLKCLFLELDLLSKLKSESGLSVEIEDPCWIQEENPSLLFNSNDYHVIYIRFKMINNYY